MIKFIDVNKIYLHPDNPRKDLGDVSELADSLKVSGVLRNLTLVPRGEDTYTVIIGHRRLAAAKMAGLEKVPCVITEMTEKEQIATMLLENMQRSDLTIYEQAQGFQMMMDFGETVEDISEKTGFSKSTVRRRMNLLSLDKDKFRASVERGATLLDYEKLDKIKDVELKNKVLDKLGTANFDWEYKNALKLEKGKETKIKILEQLESFAEKTDSTKGLICTDYISISGSGEVKIPEDTAERKYYYEEMMYAFKVYAEKSDADIEKENIKAEERAKNNEISTKFSEFAKQAFELRREFLKLVYVKKEMIPDLIRFAFLSLVKNAGNYRIIRNDEFSSTAGIGDEDGTLLSQVVSGQFGMDRERALLLAAYCNFHDSPNESYADYRYKYKVNEKLDIIYEFFEKLGYQISDEERAWREGTHRLFVKND